MPESKLEALKLILKEWDNERRTMAGLKRVRKSAHRLGLSDDEIIELEKVMEYRNGAGEFYPLSGHQEASK
jgi:hypothetical protein